MTDLARNESQAPSGVQTEDELLDSPRPTTTDAPSTPAIVPEPSPSTPVNNDKDNTDTIADRVQVIFGQKRASDDVTDSEPVSKVVNTGETGATASSSTIVTVSGNDTAPEQMEIDPTVAPPNTQPVDMAIDEDDVGDKNAPGDNEQGGAGVIQEGQNNNAEGNAPEWPEEVDEPAEFPDVGFPLTVPEYPSHPEFTYRYRSGPDSTPKRRRTDFDRSIVLPQCRRDPHTNRIAQDDYDAREQAEMALSLG